MASTLKIQIKRSVTTATPGTSLDAGELAYSYDSNTLYVGAAGGVGTAAIPIGGSGIYATVNSPIFTGDPQAPTPAAGDDDTSIPTTEWVRDLPLSAFTGDNDSDLNLNNFKIVNLADPTNPNDGANKRYVDNAVQGLDAKPSVRLKTTNNINIASPGNVVANYDGVQPNPGDRILVTNQTDATENGIYVYNGPATALTRSEDADTGTLSANAYTFIEEGAQFADSGFVLFNVQDPINVGSDPLEWTQFNGTGSIDAGNGLTTTGNTINVNTANAGRIIVNADNIDLATTGVTTGTYIGFAVDAYGRVTSVTTPTTLSGYGITDAQPRDADLTAIAALTNTGLVVRTGNSTYATRTIEGTANQVTIVNGDAVSGNPTVSISNTYPGQPSINTVGTITTGTWRGDTIALEHGGTGADLTPGTNANCIVAVNSNSTALEAIDTIDGGTF